MLFREVVVSIDREMKSLLRAIWTRKSGSVPGSESKEKVADLAVNTLDRGVRVALGMGLFEKGAIEMPGNSPAWTLPMRRYQSVADR